MQSKKMEKNGKNILQFKIKSGIIHNVVKAKKVQLFGFVHIKFDV